MVSEKYVVERVIGAGGVGVVVAATHRGLGEQVAIKFLQRAAAQSQENLARFDREGRALARIKSEHVARIMDTGTLPSGEPFMVMELLDGQDFSAVLRTRGKLPIVEAVDSIVQACEAVVLCHQLSIVHRDLKPANLFLTRAADGTPIIKVLDFGISKLLASSEKRDQAVTQSTSVIGSPLYMSPEQMECPKDADERSDVWSLGVILYELITGKPPFEAPTMPILCARICTAPPTPMEVHDVTVPAALERAIERCLAKNRDDRFASVAELARAIAKYGYASTQANLQRIERIALGSSEQEELTTVMQVTPEASAVDDRAGFPASPPSDPVAAPDSATKRLAWESSPPPPLERRRPQRRSSSWFVGTAVLLVLFAGWLQLRPAARLDRARAVRIGHVVQLQARLAHELALRPALVAPPAMLPDAATAPAPQVSAPAPANSATVAAPAVRRQLPVPPRAAQQKPRAAPDDVLQER